MLYFIGQVFPYIAMGVFLAGLAWRVLTWLKAPVPFQLTMFPAPASAVERVTAVGKQLCLFTPLYKGDRTLWFWAWIMHVSLALVIVGHIVGIYFLTQQFTLIGLSPKASTLLSESLGTVAGIMLLLSLLALFYRRTAIAEVKRLSDPADYFDLLLILAVVITGMHMRLPTVHVDLPVIRTYLGGLLTLQPVPIPENWLFISHFLLVNILMIYFPFSKLVHLLGSVVSRAMISEAPPVYPTPAGVQRQATIFAKEGQSYESSATRGQGTGSQSRGV
ncbi:MAG: respiratory nitrate reductase subunit gamma [Negativicutes bacterium]|nr:respiratory nitrate reductase subunit gamma [Negativicutes bacterium]